MNRYKNARECMLAIGANGNGYEQRIAELEAERDKYKADVERLRKATKLALGALRMWRDVDAIAILSEVEGA